MIQQGLFTSEAVSRGHPDKICDQISDAILDLALARSLRARVAVETLVKDQHVVLAGELDVRDGEPLAAADYAAVVHEVIADIGYIPERKLGFDAGCCRLQNLIGAQSADIAQGVDRSEEELEQGAGDQGMVFGYACDEVAEALMPAPLHYAHQLMRAHERAMAEDGAESMLRPDAKSQVTMRYQDGRPVAVDAIVLSTQHRPEAEEPELHECVRARIIEPAIPQALRRDGPRLLINPTGRFVTGGPVGDCGLTGRKLIVDTYGGMARHGGGAFSGKDPSKVDRSAAYAARYVAKHIVAAGLASRCEVQIAYAIGTPKPVSVLVDTFGTARPGVPDAALGELLTSGDVFDLRPGGIIRMLGLVGDDRPRYRETSAHGHFGHADLRNFPWENTDRIQQLQHALEGA